MQKNLILASIIILGIGLSLFIAHLNGNLYRTKLSDYRDDSRFFIEKAEFLLKEGSFRDDLSEFRKPPVYPLFLAVVFSLFGHNPIGIWVVQILLFAVTLVLLYLISRRFFADTIAFVPSLLLALYWGNAYLVFSILSYGPAVFLLVFLVYLTFYYKEQPSLQVLIVWSLILSILILTRPIVLYATPFLVGFLLYNHLQKSRRIFIGEIMLVTIILTSIVGAWLLRNQILFNDYQIEQTGHIIWVKGAIAEASLRDIAAYGVSGLLGDFVADRFFPGYALSPLPMRINRTVKQIWSNLRVNGMNDFEIDAYFLREGIIKIRRNISGVFLSSIPSIFEINAPMNHKGFSLAHFLTGTRPSISDNARLTIIILIRGAWLFFLSVVAYGFVRAYKTDRRWRVLLFLIVYFVYMHALLIIPAYGPYIAPVMPFYFMLATLAIREIFGIETTSKKK